MSSCPRGRKFRNVQLKKQKARPRDIRAADNSGIGRFRQKRRQKTERRF